MKRHDTVHRESPSSFTITKSLAYFNCTRRESFFNISSISNPLRQKQPNSKDRKPEKIWDIDNDGDSDREKDKDSNQDEEDEDKDNE